jgi:hypothetical protein
MRRFTRLTNAFSRQAENHAAMVSLFFMSYNFSRAHQTFRVTPAMEAGVSDHAWSVEQIVGIAMTEAEFWTNLEYRLSRELASLSDKRLRFLTCDGVFPDNNQVDPHVRTGRAVISEDNGRTFQEYRFTLSVPLKAHRHSHVDWSMVLPGDEVHDWLDIDRGRRAIEIRP